MKKLGRRFLRALGRRTQGGVTLVEVLAAMTILGLGLLSLMPMAVTSITANAAARNTRAAMEKIQNRMEGFRIADSVVAGSQLDTLSGMYTSWWTENAGTDLKRVIIEVTWTGDAGMMHRQRGSAYLYKK